MLSEFLWIWNSKLSRAKNIFINLGAKITLLVILSEFICLCCRRWRRYGRWLRWGNCTKSTGSLTHSASNHETWAAQEFSTCSDPNPDPSHHHYLLHHSTHLHPAQTPSAASAAQSSTVGSQVCSWTNTHSHDIQHSHHPQSTPDPDPDTDGDDAQPTPDSYCPRFSVPSFSHPSSQPCHPGRGSQTHCPPGSLHHNLCPVSPRPPTHWSHHRSSGGSPEPASPYPLPPTGGHTISCGGSHHPHIKPRPPPGEWHYTSPGSCHHHWQADSSEHPNVDPPPTAGGSDSAQPCDNGDHALLPHQHSEAGLSSANGTTGCRDSPTTGQPQALD